MGSDGHYRAYLKFFDRDGMRTETTDIGDDSRTLIGGVRVDWGPAERQLMLQADAYKGEVARGRLREFSGMNVLGRWTRVVGDSNLRLQGYFDRTEREHAGTFRETLDTFDLELQHGFKPAPAHHLVWGAGYRHSRDDTENSASQAFIPPDRTLTWTSAFVQDEIALRERIFLTLGLKAERNPYTGNEWLPSVRLAWHPGRDALVWAAVSRAVRAPSRLDRELNIPGRPPFLLAGSDRFESEVANVGELGYRRQLTSVFSFSATAFHHDYRNLRSIAREGNTPFFANDIEGRVRGLETWASWRPFPSWRLTSGFVVQDVERRVKPGAADFGGLAALGNDAERWATLRSAWSPRSDIDVDIAMRHVGALETGVPSYTAADARIAWRPRPSLELSLTVLNALDDEHVEWSNRGLVERSFVFKVVWKP